MVDLIGHSAAQCHVGAMAVVPRGKISKLAQKRSSPERDQRQPCDTLLERQDQSLHHGNAAVLTDRAEPRTDALPPAPRFELFAGELGTLITNQVPGLCSCRVNHATQESTYRLGGRLSPEESDAHDPPRVMVRDRADPPSEKPKLGGPSHWPDSDAVPETPLEFPSVGSRIFHFKAR